jgi:O-succinylhomoserine sulfhydrylase
VAKKAGALLAVDNVFCTPILQRPLELGADLVVHSATKHLDGQGRVLGGAILGSNKLVMEHVFPFLRTAGPSLSPFNAWVILKGLETLELRMRAQSAAAYEMAQWLERQPGIARVHYPWLESHPQHALAKRQQKAGGAVLSFELKGGRDAAFRLINGTRLISITANLGDVKSTITHPATTTHSRISPEARAAAGITDGLVRIAVGLEAVSDLQADLERGLS